MANCLRLAALGLALVFSGCADRAPAKRHVAPFDPVEAAALAAPLLIDPELTAMSRRYELLSFGEPIEPVQRKLVGRGSRPEVNP